MSEENVEIVRTLLEGFAHRQHERALDLCDPEIEWDASRMAGRLPMTSPAPTTGTRA
jgi:hypothetical protein